MMKPTRMLLVMAAVVMPIAAVAGVGVTNAWASTVATGTVTCTGVSGSAKFSPALTSSGPTSGTEKITTKITFSHCTTSGSNVTAHSNATGSAKGTITDSTGSSCTGLFGVINVSASLPVKWKYFDRDARCEHHQDHPG